MKAKNKDTKRDIKTKLLTISSSIVMIVISVLLIFSIYYLDFLPIKYLSITIGILLLIDIISIFLSTYEKIPKKIKMLKVFGDVFLSVVMIIISLCIHRTDKFLNEININYKTLNYSIIVLKETDYDEIDDLLEKEVGFLNNDNEGMNKAIQKCKELVNSKMIAHDDLNELRDELLNEEIPAIIIENSYYDILKDQEYAEEEKTNFEQATKVIYSFSINLTTGEITKSVENVTIDPFNIYISGLDTYGPISNVSRTDVNMIITVNPESHQILLTSIPRDYYVQLHGTSGLKDKLTHSGIYGIDMSVQTIEDLFDIDINYYLKVNFSSVIQLVNELGGVDVYSEYSFTSQNNYQYINGYNHVDGKKALSFVRERKNLPNGDRQRIKDQQALIDAIFKKVTKPEIIINYNSLLRVLEKIVMTNMSSDEITDLIKMQLNENSDWTVTTNCVDGYDSQKYTYSASSQLLYVMIPDDDSLKEATDMINKVLKGQKLKSSFIKDGDDTKSNTLVKADLLEFNSDKII